jgi:integrase
LLPAFGEVRAADFGTRDLKRYLAKRRREEATNATIDREFAIVKRAIRLAAKADPLHTGAHVEELEALQDSQVDLKVKRIVLQPAETKNDEVRTLPISGEMLEWLRLEKEIRESKYPKCTYVFHENGEKLKAWRGDWDDASARAGVPGLVP